MIVRALQTEIEACAVRLHAHPLLLSAQRGEVPPEAVARYLSSVLFLVQHTPIHLELARATAEAEGALELARYFGHKAVEEQGHDAWAEADLQQLGARFGELALSPQPCPAIRALVAELSRGIREEPAAYLAYILFAEYITVLMGPIWVGALQKHCGVPQEALTVVSRHAELDREHVADCLAELEGLLVDADPARVRALLSLSIHHFEAFCDELCEAARAARAA